MLSGKHPLFKRLRRVVRGNLHFRPAEHLAGIELFRDDVNRTTADRVPRGEGAGVLVLLLLVRRRRRKRKRG